ncbi:MATE family efflux transporter [Aliikangiella maris]|uniref:MATE family efflux transporter n=2 Tax=Aliikangiella maris TaxID=3162458 RepID=A0ABV2BRN8_9GAMM
MTMAPPNNKYLSGSLSSVFLKTATPIILMMLVNGSFNLVDAYFLGIFVGADALSAVTAMFPLVMLMVALSTLVGNGFASIMARLLGAGKAREAQSAFAQAITLSLLVCVLLIILFFIFGKVLTLAANNGVATQAAMSFEYLSILISASPLIFILTVNGDALCSQGHTGFMATVSICTVLINGLANYILIVTFNLGVAGSAYGTLLAQIIALGAIFIFRINTVNPSTISVFHLTRKKNHWKAFLALGAPSSFGYIGLSLSSSAILFNLQQFSSTDYAATLSAYGILTRLMTFAFLPLLGLSLAFQSITGNNVGARQWQRTNSCIKIALLSALIYCASIEGLLWLLKDSVGGWFVNDERVVQEVSRILPIMTLALFLLGPLLMISSFFQSIGDAIRASVLGLSKTYLFALPLIFLMPVYFGEWGIWYAGPLAECLTLILTLFVLYQRSSHTQDNKKSYAFGLFYAKESV